jgi:hypothetical protein
MRFEDIPGGPLHYCDDCALRGHRNCLAGGDMNRNTFGTCSLYVNREAHESYIASHPTTDPYPTLHDGHALDC